MPLPITGELDLHTFRPQDVGRLIPEYVEESLRHGLTSIRLIHGKGTGQLARSVHAILARVPEVLEFGFATEPFGGLGVTIVRLRPLEGRRG
jgi:dsDNA-specific endonuclease/ATPase MutS2